MTPTIQVERCSAVVSRVGSVAQLCDRPATIHGLCGAHYQQKVRNPSGKFKPIRPRGNMVEVKVLVPEEVAEALHARAKELRMAYPEVVRAALAMALPGQLGRLELKDKKK